MADSATVAQQFTSFYFQTFDSDRSQLGGLYRDHSVFSFEGATIQGTQNIVEKLTSLPFQKVQHQITTTDVQPLDPSSGSILVLVTGALLVDEEKNPMNFTQAFTLIPDGGSFYVLNDIFRLNMH